MTSPYLPMSSQVLLARGKCCQSTCLHCPYGYTLKKCGLDFIPFDFHLLPADYARLEQKTTLFSFQIRYWITEKLSKENFLQFLKDDGESGEPLGQLRWYEVTLKNVSCALIGADTYQVKKILMAQDFSDQGINREMIESFLF
jgi:hypothetical protein